MLTTTTFPGIYIEELIGQPLSISAGATAVPAIAVDDTVLSDVLRINSWLEFSSKRSISQVGNTLHVVLRTYFENGGGYCYLIPTGKLIEEVPKYDDITLLVAAGQGIQTAVNLLCVSGASLFAILDGPNLAPDEIDMTAYESSSYTAVYYPWLQAGWAVTAEAQNGNAVTRSAASVDIPPSAAVAGAYCTTDRSRGVWKAPANVALKGGLQPKYKISDTVQGLHNQGKALNMIRHFDNGDALIWGARTLDDSDAWRYVPVRRLFNSIQKDLRRTMQSVVFEPNSQATWERVRGAIDNYLRQLWRQGGLQGNTDKEAYFVQIGLDVSMTADDIAQGKLIANVGLAAVRPAEFIILKFTQDMGQN